MKANYSVKFNGKIIETTVAKKASEADIWVQNTNNLMLMHQYNSSRVIGMDCKFIYHPISSMSNKMAILQLCFDTRCLVLQLLHMDSIPQSVRDFLSNSQTTFVGINIHENSTKLLKEYELTVMKKVDVHFLAKQWFPVSYKGRPSMRALANEIVGFPMRKCSKNNGIIKGNWESRCLDTELIEQACVDAYASYAMAHKLLRNDDSL
ncbi:hypothetical protein ACS0TY_012873 [Phlomoides rotata]